MWGAGLHCGCPFRFPLGLRHPRCPAPPCARLAYAASETPLNGQQNNTTAQSRLSPTPPNRGNNPILAIQGTPATGTGGKPFIHLQRVEPQPSLRP
jgi:hypothetical protein